MFSLVPENIQTSSHKKDVIFFWFDPPPPTNPSRNSSLAWCVPSKILEFETALTAGFPTAIHRVGMNIFWNYMHKSQFSFKLSSKVIWLLGPMAKFNTYVAIPSLINTHDKVNSREADTSFLLATFMVSVISEVRFSTLT